MFDEFAQLYEVCMKVSPALTPPVVDDMELWEVAVALGKALPGEPTTDQLQAPAPSSDAATKRYRAIQRRRAGLPDLEDDDADSPAPVDPALATLITTNAPERLR